MSYGMRNAPLSSKQIALLHVAANKLGLDEGSYRSVLSLYGGAESAKEMTFSGFRRVMVYFQQLGFKMPEFRPPGRTRREPDALIATAQMNKIRALFGDMGINTAERQQGFCRRNIKKSWPQTRMDGIKIIEALKAMLARQS